jgi:hypothetical protein
VRHEIHHRRDRLRSTVARRDLRLGHEFPTIAME